VILAQGLHNGPASPDLAAAYRAEQQAVLQKIGSTPLSELAALAAWRKVFRSFGVDPTQIRSSAEALLRRLTKAGDIPSINTLVDVGNLLSIRYGLPIAVMDAAQMRGGITVKLAAGTEPFLELGKNADTYPEAGEVVFVDAADRVHARRWCWRQSEASAAQARTTQAIITLEAHHAAARQDVENAAHDLESLLRMYATGENLQLKTQFFPKDSSA
jgi:DNA/RNA-binding domain of Phe-tRNA-synthetase-like protein